MTGIDISGVQPTYVVGDWEFIVVKSTEGNGVVNPKVGAQWTNAQRTTRGLYHYARPHNSGGLTQANVFCKDALERGFRPGVDIWQLDCEDGLNGGVTSAEWRQFITDFMPYALHTLGNRGFLYAGSPFLASKGLLDLVYRFMWWLPDYGNNDGSNHGIEHLGPSAQGLVVIHQYTSYAGLDQNAIYNRAAYLQSAPKPGVSVTAQFSPPLNDIRSVLVRTGLGAWGLSGNGGIFTFAGPFQGSLVDDPDFAGRVGAQLVRPGLIVPGARPPFATYPTGALYEVIAESGERYVPKRK